MRKGVRPRSCDCEAACCITPGRKSVVMAGRIVRFPRHVGVEVIPGAGVYLLAQGRNTVLRGKLVEQLAPLLLKGATRVALRHALAASFPGSVVDRGLDRLLTAGLVVERWGDSERDDAGFWELAGVAPDSVSEAIENRSVRAVAVGGASTDAFTEAATAQGLRLGDGDPGLTVVLTSDFLHPDILAFNQDALKTGSPWLVAKLTGESAWISPVLEPRHTACWSCLVQRARGHRQLQATLARMTHRDYVPVMGDVRLTTATGLAARLAVLRVTQWMAGLPDEPPTIVSFDPLALESRKHRLTRRPQCPDCGDPTLVATAAHLPPALRSVPAAPGADGGYRSRGQYHVLDTYGHLVSPITGVVSELTRMKTSSELLHVYSAGHNFAMGRPRELSRAQRALRTESAGKGMSDLQARASALGEAIERYSGVWQGDEAHIVTSARALGADAVPLDTLQHFSEDQFRNREEWRGRGTPVTWVPDPFDEAQDMAWTPVWSLSEEAHKYVPTAYLYYDFPTSTSPVVALADSNGNAAGSSLEEAILQGFFELVERDSVAMWWYNRTALPAIDVNLADIAYIERWQEHYASIGRETWVLDLTSDLGIPVAAAVSRRTDGPTEDILFGFGAHFDPAVAVTRALTEMNQFLAGLLEFRSAPNRAEGGPDTEWWRTATLENQPYLAPRGTSGLFTRQARQTPMGPDLLSGVREAQRIVKENDMEMLVLDQTRPDICLPVVKVIVPGLRSFWPRYAPGRLYDVPVALGWTESRVPETELNPIAMFL
ncbi:TOMM precursor leader peptide-binding protein [Streptomyces lunaelactis]|uniref:TOMM precursor leader peptide-binding protein n=1 Tax=Streptomyces lunaelactis TaxID=1535768 RepID=UPI001585CAA0|nr:TOMM precursor leader peptide-binding protein [Streptomyces lunaelactis]NUL03032.1 TOMM precursor leader peptide-binding protein [Streptomyces lunaelactis]